MVNRSKVYIHYGSRYFDKDLFMPIYNLPVFSKPSGGLWASPVTDCYGWGNWCDEANFRECKKSNSFRFVLKDSANILDIVSGDTLNGLPKVETDIFKGFKFDSWDCLDFEQLLKDGVDAIEVSISQDRRLYWRLYGWDCDSILVLNKDIVVQIDYLRRNEIRLRQMR